MTQYTDTYIVGADKNLLDSFLSNFVNKTGSVSGQSYDGDSTDVDKSLFYACIRLTFDPQSVLPSELQIVSSDIGALVCGVWA